MADEKDFPTKMKMRTTPKKKVEPPRRQTVELVEGKPQFVTCMCKKDILHFDGKADGRLIPIRPHYDCLVCNARTYVKIKRA